MDFYIDDLYMIRCLGIHYPVDILVVLAIQFYDIRHFDPEPIVLDIRKPSFELVNYPKHYIWLFGRME
jgi:hypothetical protein